MSEKRVQFVRVIIIDEVLLGRTIDTYMLYLQTHIKHFIQYRDQKKNTIKIGRFIFEYTFKIQYGFYTIYILYHFETFIFRFSTILREKYFPIHLKRVWRNIKHFTQI